MTRRPGVRSVCELAFLLRIEVNGNTQVLGTTTGLGIPLGAGKWLVREDPLEQAAAIAVLSGNIPTRALEAARLYHDGYAKEIWLTHTRTHAGGLKVLGIHYPRFQRLGTLGTS